LSTFFSRAVSIIVVPTEHLYPSGVLPRLPPNLVSNPTSRVALMPGLFAVCPRPELMSILPFFSIRHVPPPLCLNQEFVIVQWSTAPPEKSSV